MEVILWLRSEFEDVRHVRDPCRWCHHQAMVAHLQICCSHLSIQTSNIYQDRIAHTGGCAAAQGSAAGGPGDRAGAARERRGCRCCRRCRGRAALRAAAGGAGGAGSARAGAAAAGMQCFISTFRADKAIRSTASGCVSWRRGARRLQEQEQRAAEKARAARGHEHYCSSYTLQLLLTPPRHCCGHSTGVTEPNAAALALTCIPQIPQIWSLAFRAAIT